MAEDKRNDPYHFMETNARITTAAEIRVREGDLLTDLLSVEENFGSFVGGRHVQNLLSLWLGDQGDPASVVVVCDRLLAAIQTIRERNARLVSGEPVSAIAGLTPDKGDHFVREAVA